jgi:phosphatidylglycerophosphate synthase
MTTVVMVGRDATRLLGLPLWRHTQLAVERAGLNLRDEVPATGDVILLAGDAVVTTEALRELVTRERAAGAVLVDQRGGVARMDAAAATAVVASAGHAWPRDNTVVALATTCLEGGRNRRRAEELLLRAACKPLLSGDPVGRLNRELSLPLVRLFARTPLTPNAITLIGFLITLASAVPLAHGGYRMTFLGALLQWLGSLLDAVDGKIARLKGQTSPFGSWLDVGLDFVYYALLFGALAAGLVAGGNVTLARFSVAVAGSGLSLCIPLIIFMRRRLVPAEHPERFGTLIYRLIDQHRRDPLIAVARAGIRFITRAGLPHVVLVLALVDGIPVLMSVASVATHVVWVIALRLLWLLRSREMVNHAA